MSRATTLQSNKPAGTSARRKSFLVISLSILAVFVLTYISLASIFPPSVKISPAPGSQDVPLDKQLKVSTSWMRGHIKSVSVKEISFDAAGAPIAEKAIDGHLEGNVFVTSDGPMPLHPDCRYEVTVNADLTEFTLAGLRHREVTEHSSFQTITTPAPLFSHETQIVAIDEPIVVEFNTPIKAFTYELSPEISSSSSIDESNPSRAYITLSGYEQGQKYDLTITEAKGQNGASLKHPYTQKVATTEPLRVVFVPGDGEAGVSQGERPTLTFTEKIRNPEEAEQLLSLEPSTLGSWTWVAPDKLEFKPLQEWAKGTKVTIRLKGGPEGFRGESGSFLRQDVESSFTIRPSKIIDVNLTEQRVYAYDNDQLVRTMICSSGSMATPSLTGTYAVYAKAEKVDMRGADYFAPNVPWVLMFNGDYTIHGNYWATSFGVPTSHGCVGLPLSDAEWLYNWTPLGTIVQIHY